MKITVARLKSVRYITYMGSASGAAKTEKKMKTVQERTQQDCNWIVAQAAKLRSEVRAKRLQGVTGLEARLAVKIEVAKMDYNELLRYA